MVQLYELNITNLKSNKWLLTINVQMLQNLHKSILMIFYSDLLTKIQPKS